MKTFSSFLSLLLASLIAVMPVQAEMAPALGSVPGGPTTASGQNNALQIRLADAGNAVVEASSSLKGYAVLVTDGSGLPVSDAAVAIRLPEDGATGFFVDGARSAVSYTDAAGIATFPQVNWNSTLGIAGIRVTAVKGDRRAGALIEQTIVARSAVTSTAKAQADPLSALPVPQAAAVINSTPAPLQPGTPTSIASVRTGAESQQPVTRPAQTSASPEPVVSIVNSGGSHSSSNKKWILLALVAAGAGIGAAMALGGHAGSAAAAPSTGITIGAPSVSVGH